MLHWVPEAWLFVEAIQRPKTRDSYELRGTIISSGHLCLFVPMIQDCQSALSLEILKMVISGFFVLTNTDPGMSASRK